MSYRGLLKDSVNISVATGSYSGGSYGAQTTHEVWSCASESKKCRLDTAAGSKISTAEKISSRTTHLLTMEAQSGYDPEDYPAIRATVTEAGESTSRVYTVLHTAKPANMRKTHHWLLYLEYGKDASY